MPSLQTQNILKFRFSVREWVNITKSVVSSIINKSVLNELFLSFQASQKGWDKMKWSFSKKSYMLKIVTRKVCKLIQEKEFVKCFNLKGNTLVDIHNESGGKHSSLLKKAVTLFSIDKMYQKKKPFPLMMWGKKTNCMWEHLIIHTSLGNVYPLDLSLLTSIVLAADSVLYWTHPFVKIKEILYSHFQFSSLLKKNCNVVWVVNLLKTALMNQQSRHM